MAPLMSLNGNDIVELSLLEPTGKELRTFPLLKEEATLLGEELELPEFPEAAASSKNVWKLASPWNPLSRLMLQVPLLLQPLHQNPAATLPRKQRNPSEGLRLTQASPVIGSSHTLKRRKEYLSGGENSSPFSTPRRSPSMTFKSKN